MTKPVEPNFATRITEAFEAWRDDIEQLLNDDATGEDVMSVAVYDAIRAGIVHAEIATELAKAFASRDAREG